MNGKRRPLPALTGLRFFLATWVVVFHANPSVAQPAIDSLLHTGFVAVGVFFTLSGFVLAYNYSLGNPWGSREQIKFGVARFARIYPAYFVALLMLLPVAVYRIYSEIPLLEYSLPDGLLSLLLVQAWFPDAALSWNYPGWSLSAEAFFYACFPFLGYRLWKLQSRTAMLVCLGALWVLSLMPPILAGFGDADNEFWINTIRYNPLAGLPAFCSGIVLARLYLSMPADSPWFGRGDWLAMPALAVMLAVLASVGGVPLIHNGLLLPVYSVLIFGLALGGGAVARVLAIPLFLFLGNASYAMYILHFPIAEWLLLAGKVFHRSLLISSWSITIAYLVMVIAGSSIFYRFVEEPVHQRLRRALTDRLVGATPSVR